MVEVQRVRSNGKDYVGIYISLAVYPIHMIVSPQTILTTDCFAIDFFEKKEQVAVVLCPYESGFDKILDSDVKMFNNIAKARGVKQGMNMKEALILCENDQSEAS